MSVPKLRFQKFNGKWVKANLSQIVGSLESGVSVNSEDREMSLASEKGILKTSCISGGCFYPEEHKVILDEDVCRAKLNPKSGSILVSRMNTPMLVGEVGFVSYDCPRLFVPDRLWLVDVADNSTDSTRWLCFQLTTPSLRYELGSVATGTSGSMKNISQPSFLGIEIFKPSLAEQTKIAAFLTAVDEKITQLTQKHKLLTQYKKGVLQKIFNQDLRFKDEDGRDFPEWVPIELHELAFKSKTKNKDGSIKSVLTNSATLGVINQSDYFDRDIANQNNLEGYYVVEKDDFVYNPRISSTAPVGPINRNNQAKGVMSPLYTVFRFKSGFLDFFELYFQTNCWHDHMKSVANSGARHDRMNITNEDFFSLPLLLPCEKEQTKIANFLSAIDDKISNAQSQLEAMGELLDDKIIHPAIR